LSKGGTPIQLASDLLGFQNPVGLSTLFPRIISSILWLNWKYDSQRLLNSMSGTVSQSVLVSFCAVGAFGRPNSF
jgi:hypothetical protein